MKSTNRAVHFYGDSHMQGFEIDHDQILGRNTYKEKKDLIHQFGLHQAIVMWNQKMGRATKMSVYNFAHRRLPESYPLLVFPESRLNAWPAMSYDYLHLRLVHDYHRGLLNDYDRVFIGVARPTRTYKLDEMGNFDYRYEDLDGKANQMTDIQYACAWTLGARSIMDFMEKRHIEYKFIKHFDIFDRSIKDIHNIDIPKGAIYTNMFYDTFHEVIEKAIPQGLHNFGEMNGFYHRNADAHKQFAAYLKNYLT